MGCFGAASADAKVAMVARSGIVARGTYISKVMLPSNMRLEMNLLVNLLSYRAGILYIAVA